MNQMVDIISLKWNDTLLIILLNRIYSNVIYCPSRICENVEIIVDLTPSDDSKATITAKFEGQADVFVQTNLVGQRLYVATSGTEFLVRQVPPESTNGKPNSDQEDTPTENQTDRRPIKPPAGDSEEDTTTTAATTTTTELSTTTSQKVAQVL